LIRLNASCPALRPCLRAAIPISGSECLRASSALPAAPGSAAPHQLDITGTLTIFGAGPNSTRLDGNGGITGDRALHILSGAVTTSGVTVYIGWGQGIGDGGVFHSGGGHLNLYNSIVAGNLKIKGAAAPWPSATAAGPS
jgi:hypothetical protein